MKPKKIINYILVASTIYSTVLAHNAVAQSNVDVEIQRKVEKVNQLNEKYTSAWKANFLKEYHKIISDVPNPEQMARDLMKEHFPTLDPDKTHFVIFNTHGGHFKPPAGKSKSIYYFKGHTISDVMTLTQAALLQGPRRASSIFHNYANYSAVYTDFKPHREWYSNGLDVVNRKLGRIISSADINTQFKTKIQEYWETHYERYKKISKDAFSLWAYESYKNFQISDEGYQLAESVIANNGNANVFKFDVYGYFSNSILWIENQSGSKGLLYIPGATTPLREFNGITAMREFIANEMKDKKSRESFAHHFSLYDRQDGTTYSGVDSALEGVSGERRTIWNSNYILYEKTPITTDAFTALADLTKEREFSDGDTLITSDSEAISLIALRSVNSALNFLPIIDLIAPEVALPLDIIVGLTELGLSIDIDIEGDTKADRVKGASGIANSGLFLGSAAVVPALVKYAPRIITASERFLADETLNVINLRNLQGIPLKYENIGLNGSHTFTHSVTNKSAQIVRLSDDYRLVTIAEDDLGAFREINFDSGDFVNNKKIIQENGVWKNEKEPICPFK